MVVVVKESSEFSKSCLVEHLANFPLPPLLSKANRSTVYWIVWHAMWLPLHIKIIPVTWKMARFFVQHWKIYSCSCVAFRVHFVFPNIVTHSLPKWSTIRLGWTFGLWERRGWNKVWVVARVFQWIEHNFSAIFDWFIEISRSVSCLVL